MLDFQVVYVRDRIRLTGAEPLSMLKIVSRTPKRAEELSSVTSVTIDGLDSKFFRMPGGSLMTSVPNGVYLTTTALFALDRPGVPLEVRILRELSATNKVAETIDPLDLRIDTDTMRVTGDDFRNAVEVLVNSTSVGFVVVDPTTLLCQIPKDTDVVETVEVLSSTSKVTGTSSFTYMIGANPASVGGIEKLTHQFIKLLWTTRGSDTFNKDLGGNLQKFVGSTTDVSGSEGLIRVVTDVQRTAALMTAGQVQRNLPQDEVLAQAEVLNFQVSPSDPTSFELELRLRTLSGLSAVISTVVGNPQAASQKLAKDLLGVG
jgi:hypothetical protein